MFFQKFTQDKFITSTLKNGEESTVLYFNPFGLEDQGMLGKFKDLDTGSIEQITEASLEMCGLLARKIVKAVNIDAKGDETVITNKDELPKKEDFEALMNADIMTFLAIIQDFNPKAKGEATPTKS
jgi:hypothetical protein